jgi:hypothetical protein
MQVSDQELLSRIESLARNEHEMTVDVLLHMNEVERRRLHLTLGYGTMFDFATRHLRYSSSAAGRRIQVARCIARHPELLVPLRGREINLSTIGLIAGVLDAGNVKELIDAIRGKSQREVEQIVATYQPAVQIRDRVRPVRVRREADRPDSDRDATPLFTVASTCSSNGIDVRDRNDTRSRVTHSRCGSSSPESGCRSGPRESPSEPQLSEPRFKVEFEAGPDCVRMLEEARAILSSHSPTGVSLGRVIETALEEFLNRRSPFRRKQRRERRSSMRRSAAVGGARRRVAGATGVADGQVAADGIAPGGIALGAVAAGGIAPGEIAVDAVAAGGAHGKVRRSGSRAAPVVAGDARAQDNGRGKSGRSRHVPAAVRDEVYARDGGRCTYVGANGVACGSRHQLHIDHVEPFAQGGAATLENLRLLCASHNQLEAERVYGSDWMRRSRGGGTNPGANGQHASRT